MSAATVAAPSLFSHFPLATRCISSVPLGVRLARDLVLASMAAAVMSVMLPTNWSIRFDERSAPRKPTTPALRGFLLDRVGCVTPPCRSADRKCGVATAWLDWYQKLTRSRLVGEQFGTKHLDRPIGPIGASAVLEGDSGPPAPVPAKRPYALACSGCSRGVSAAPTATYAEVPP